MLPTDGKAVNGFYFQIRWSFFNPLGNFFESKAVPPCGISVFSLTENPV